MDLMCFHRSSNQGSACCCFFPITDHKTHALLQEFEEMVKTNRDSMILSQSPQRPVFLIHLNHSSSSSSSSPSDREAQGQIWRYLSNHFSTIWVTRGWLRRRELFCMATNMPPSVTQQSSHSLSSLSCCSSFPFCGAHTRHILTPT